MEAASRGVRVVGGGRAVRGHELFDGADVLGEVLDRDRDVLDDRDRLVVAADAHQETQPALRTDQTSACRAGSSTTTGSAGTPLASLRCC